MVAIQASRKLRPATLQLIMKEVNAYYTRKWTAGACRRRPDLEKLQSQHGVKLADRPRLFENYQLTNNNAGDPPDKGRIEQLSKQAQREFSAGV